MPSAPPLGATGGLGRPWLLVEIDGAWGPHAFLDSTLDMALGRAIALRAERDGLTTVHLRHGADEIVVALRETWTEPLLSTCGARALFPVRRYEAVSMQVLPGER